MEQNRKDAARKSVKKFTLGAFVSNNRSTSESRSRYVDEWKNHARGSFIKSVLEIDNQPSR